MGNGWIRGCVHGALTVLHSRGEIEKPDGRFADDDERDMEAVYQQLRTTDNRVLADAFIATRESRLF